MKKLLVMTAMLMALSTAQAERTFTHPGALVSNTEIANMKRHIEAKEQPWLSEWNALVSAYGSANYTAAPNTEIGGSGGNRRRACRDAQAAFFNALIWRVRGTEANARCAANILSAWGNTCTSAKEELFQFPCLDMCTAAEFLRNEDGTFYSCCRRTEMSTCWPSRPRTARPCWWSITPKKRQQKRPLSSTATSSCCR